MSKAGQRTPRGASAVAPSDAASAYPNLSRIERTSVANEVVQRIQQLLATRKIKAGEKLLSERVMAGALGVSRTAVRDALKRLEAYGIIEVRRGKGTFVRQTQCLALCDKVVLGTRLPRRQLLQTLEARAAVDVPICGLAAARATRRDLRAIGEYLEQPEKRQPDVSKRYAPDLGFEALIGEAAHNPYLLRLQTYAHQAYAEVWSRIGFIPRSADERLADHRRILDALVRRDADAAQRAITEHLDIYAKIDPAWRRPPSPRT
jgi:GntR family transcriptional repressor for pyruvate dehydrogenase complex